MERSSFRSRRDNGFSSGSEFKARSRAKAFGSSRHATEFLKSADLRHRFVYVKEDEQPLTEERIREEKIRSRLEDRALLESGAMTPEELQRRNSLFTREEIAQFKFNFPAWRKHLARIHAASDSCRPSRCHRATPRPQRTAEYDHATPRPAQPRGQNTPHIAIRADL
jgi:hypothetical protein